MAHSEQWIVLILGLLTGIAIFDWRRPEENTLSTYGFFLFVMAGMALITRSNDFLLLGMSFEIVKLSFTALRRQGVLSSSNVDAVGENHRERTAETWLNWVSSAWLWSGIAFLSNAFGTTHFNVVRLVMTEAYDPHADQGTSSAPSKLVLLGIGLIAMSVFARMGLAPFHLRLRTALSRSPRLLGGILIIADQLVGSFILTRLFGYVFVGVGQPLMTLMMTVGLATFLLAGAMAVRVLSPGIQSVSRFLTCLVLFQSSWLIVCAMIVSAELQNPSVRWGAFEDQNETMALIVFAQLTGALAWCGVYWTLEHLGRNQRPIQFLEELKGLWQFAPVASMTLIVCLASSIGIPLTAGFWARWLTLLAGNNVHMKSTMTIFTPHEGLRVVMMTGTIVTLLVAVVVVRFAREIFLESPLARPAAIGGTNALIASGFATVIVLLLGIVPQPLFGVLRSIPSPRNLKPQAPQRGSGTTPLGLMESNEPVRRSMPQEVRTIPPADAS